MRILLMRPANDHPSPTDQSLGVRLAAQTRADHQDITLSEEVFQPGDDGDLERKLALWQDKIAAVIGATNVAQSTRLGELAEKMKLLCFVANNNPIVWQGRRQVFHIGLPTTQTTASVATLIANTHRRQILLIHDKTEFQSRVATNMEGALRGLGVEVRSQPVECDPEIQIPTKFKPDLIYLVFSSEPNALRLVRTLRAAALDVPLLFGRSLLRESFLAALGDQPGDCWFVDMFHRNGGQTKTQTRFLGIVAASGVKVPTANHAFGWDGMGHCAAALEAGGGDSSRAIDYLESGAPLAGASGVCRFSPDNHNGRFAPGPHTITRWHNHQLVDL